MKMAWALPFENKVTVARVVQSGDVDGFKSEPFVVWARMRRFSDLRNGNKMCSCTKKLSIPIGIFAKKKKNFILL